MEHTPSCPTCLAALTGTSDRLVCPEGHDYTTLAVALATNTRSVTALWMAIRALEDDAAGLTHLAGRPGFDATTRLAEAAAARQAAAQLRSLAAAAQSRLEALARDVV